MTNPSVLSRGILRAVVALAMVIVTLLVLSPGALAAGNPPGEPTPQSAPAGTPELVSSMTKRPPGFRLTGRKVLRIAKRNPTVIRELRADPKLVSYVYTRSSPYWQVSLFTPPPQHQYERLQLYIDDTTGKVTQVWTGYQVAWTMARGYPGAFGRRINALYVWLPLCAAFLLPFLPWRRRPTLWHLDLLVLLAFSVSLAFFNNANIGMSAPLVYPSLLYLFVRMLLLAFGRGRPREPLRSWIPGPWLAVLLVFLVGFRIGMNLIDSNVIDVGYAGVIGADKIVKGEPLYGNWPSNNANGDTYGPVNYFAYVPFRALFGWSGSWDNLPAAHAAAIAFDSLTMIGLLLLGWSIRGPTTGILLAYLWAAFPFTAFVLSSNSNDSLVAMMVVLALLVLRWSAARGAIGGLAAMTKYAPLALAPLLLRGLGDPPWAKRPGSGSPASPAVRRRNLWPIVWFTVAYAAAVELPMMKVLLQGNFSAFWNDSISYQAGRPAPFSIWGMWGGPGQSLRLPEHIWLGVVVALGLAVLVFPRGKRTIVQVSALGAALIIGLQMGISYWFYLYIVWFFPLVIVALVLAHPSPGEKAPAGIQLNPEHVPRGLDTPSLA